MSEEQRELSFSELRKKRARRLPAKVNFEPVVNSYDFSSSETTPPPSIAEPARRKSRLPFDPMRVVGALKRNRRWLIWSACAIALVGCVIGWFTSENKIRVTLVMRDTSTTFTAGAGDSYHPAQLSVETLVDLMTSPELARRVAAKTNPPFAENALKDSVTATLGAEKDMVTLTINGKGRRKLVDLAKLYANEALQLGRDLQVTEISRMNQFYRDRIAAADEEMARINDEMVSFQKESGTVDPDAEAEAYTKQLSELLSKADSSRLELEMVKMQVASLQNELARQNPVAQKLSAARSKLTDLLSKYTEEHPLVQGQRAQIAALEKQAAAATNDVAAASFDENSVGGTLYLRLVELQTRQAMLEKELQTFDNLKQSLQDKVTGMSKKGLRYAVIKAKLDSQKNSLSLLASRQREAQLYEANAQGSFRLFAEPRLNDVDMTGRWLKTFGFTLTGFIFGLLGAALVVAFVEVSDNRLKTAADIERVTGLPVLASLGDLNNMTQAQREQWAFRTWTALSGRLSVSANHGMVCGFISSEQSEGRSTWIKLLADAASQRGLRVLTVSAQTTSASSQTQNQSSNAQTESATRTEPSEKESEVAEQGLQVLASPLDIVSQFSSSNVPAVAHVPLSGWVWNLERRKQWQGAMMQWQAVDNLVLLVELPPASTPESVLLAENLPQLIWLADSGKQRTRETRQQIETLRHAKCRLAGAVLNHEPEATFSL